MERTIRGAQLRKLWKSYELHSIKLLRHYETLNEAQRIFKPSASQWSIAQVYFHLEQIQELARTSMMQRIKTGRIKPATRKHLWRFIRLVIALRLPVKYKVPAVAASTVSDNVDPDIYPERWISSLQEMETFLVNIPENQQNNLIFMHPYAGPFPVTLTVGFLTEHLKHHRKQLVRITRSPGYPV